MRRTGNKGVKKGENKLLEPKTISDGLMGHMIYFIFESRLSRDPADSKLNSYKIFTLFVHFTVQITVQTKFGL
jgi:hypothetical protein